MTAAETFIVSSCFELNAGDEIEARYRGVLVHRGRVTDLAPDHNLFWIADDLTGVRRLLDPVEFQVIRVRPTRGASTTACV